ncbi:MAG: hypothetical protein Q4D81_05160, partial [Eubacteriales bacterium]|nr:hypothetical protein [Eubacteriales bacterium]
NVLPLCGSQLEKVEKEFVRRISTSFPAVSKFSIVEGKRRAMKKRLKQSVMGRVRIRPSE